MKKWKWKWKGVFGGQQGKFQRARFCGFSGVCWLGVDIEEQSVANTRPKVDVTKTRQHNNTVRVYVIDFVESGGVKEILQVSHVFAP